MSKGKGLPPTAAISGLNALDLALMTQKLELEWGDRLKGWLPLLDAVEKVCRDFDSHSVESLAQKAEAVSALAELAATSADRLELVRIEERNERVDPARHEVVATVITEGPKGIIVEVREWGWEFQGRTLRRAKVVASTRGE